MRRLPRIFYSNFLKAGLTISLEHEAFNHIVRVLRLKRGAPLTLFNGNGGEFHAVLETVERRVATARIDAFSPREVESPLRTILAQGVSKGVRMNYTLQKAVELGIHEIQPLVTEHSVVNLQGTRIDQRMQHWQRVVAHACEQCGRNRLPRLLTPLSFSEWVEKRSAGGTVLIMDPRATRSLSSLRRPTFPLTLLVGPEGGLSQEELRLTQESGYTRIRLGPRIMRTETAGVALLAAVQTLWGDLG